MCIAIICFRPPHLDHGDLRIGEIFMVGLVLYFIIGPGKYTNVSIGIQMKAVVPFLLVAFKKYWLADITRPSFYVSPFRSSRLLYTAPSLLLPPIFLGAIKRPMRR